MSAEGDRPRPVVEPGDFKRAFERFQKDDATQLAAALTYYSLLSLFPALLLAVALLGLFAEQSLVDDAADYLKDAGAPTEVVDAITEALESAQRERGTAAGALVAGLATTLYGATGAFGSAGAALNRIWRVEEGRGSVKHKLWFYCSALSSTWSSTCGASRASRAATTVLFCRRRPAGFVSAPAVRAGVVSASLPLPHFVR